LIDVSLQEVMLSLVGPGVAGARYHDSTWSRVPDRPPSMGRLQTKDGYVTLNAFDDHHFDIFRKLMGNPDWCAGDEWLDMAYRTAHLMEHAATIDTWALEQERDDLYHRAANLAIPCGPINSAADVMSYAQFESRGYFVAVEHAHAGKHRYAGWPYRMSRSAPKVHRAAPLLGQHDREVKAQLASDSTVPTEKPAPRRLPLEGIRVLEFAWVWAGPYCGVLLSMLGAEVIKVDGTKRLDLTRRSVVWPREEEQTTAIGPEEGMGYNALNLNKRSVTIDLSQAEGRELARRLAASCDIVYDNMRPDALAKLGLGYDDLRRIKADLIVASSSGRGHGGPESRYLGFAMVHQSVGGGAFISGYADDHPTHSGGDVDLMNAITLAFAVVAALHHREQTGEGQFIDYSQCEGCSALLGEVLLDYDRCWGVDRWLAIEVHNDRDFEKLTDVMARPELASDPRFATAVARKTNEAELNEIIESWLRERDRDWMATQLNAAGVAAAPSRDARDLYADSHLRDRGAFVTVEHPDLGPLELVGAPFRIQGLDLQPRHAPRLGEHNDLVLGQQLGLTAEELAGYRKRHIIT
jgi:crotonobetainyl-CoA:carnitine CoA-transferase CaiB-like acyl-CoA transferase